MITTLIVVKHRAHAQTLFYITRNQQMWTRTYMAPYHQLEDEFNRTLIVPVQHLDNVSRGLDVDVLINMSGEVIMLHRKSLLYHVGHKEGIA